MSQRPKWAIPLFALGVGLVCTAAADAEAAEDAAEGPWSNQAELSFVTTEGNAQASTLGFGASFEREGEHDTFTIQVQGVRAESTSVDRVARIDAQGGIEVIETETTELTAENYSLDGRWDRDLSDSWFWYLGTGWQRDEFAGIDQRLSAVAGVGHVWVDTEMATFRADLGATWTSESPVFGDDQDFAGLRLSWKAFRQLTPSTALHHEFTLDENLDDTDDLRAKADLSLDVAINARFSLKTALLLRYDAEPGLTAVPVADTPGPATVLVQLDELDSTFKVALVINF